MYSKNSISEYLLLQEQHSLNEEIRELKYLIKVHLDRCYPY